MITRCLNLDWLEVHCLEPSGPRNAEYFRSCGFEVFQRNYGTRVYDEMFTILEPNSDEPMIEIRRSPVGLKNPLAFQVLDPHSCHVRLVNRSCYYPQPAYFLFNFLMQHSFSIMRISRIDLALDFEKFDSNINPQDLINRFLKHNYSKINQGEVTAHGKDLWDGRFWHSLKWGSPKSMITTKLYDKTMELKDKKDKPYIRQSWATHGLVDDFITLTKKKPDGTIYKPTIWRLEFSIMSSVKKWFVMEDYRSNKKKIRSVHNTLDEYFSNEQCLAIFASLVDHYFHFKKVRRNEKGELMRKDRCEDVSLFSFGEQPAFYKPETPASAKPVNRLDEALRKKLEEYKQKTTNSSIISACDLILEDLQNKHIVNAAAHRWDANELTLLRQLISMRIKKSDVPYQQTLDEVKGLIQLFGEDSFEET